jgi:hypothetical protein
VVDVQAAPYAVALEAMLLESILAPLCQGCDAVGQYEAGEFALEIAKRLQVRL